MKEFFKYIKGFPFKNLLAIFLIWRLLDILTSNKDLRDIIIIILTLVVKHYFDSNTAAAKRDETISKALDKAQQTPGVPVQDPNNTP